MTASRPDPARRGPGRPRSATADAAILEAARSVLAEDGWPGFTVERVAARAGVAKTTLYRRWSSRTDLAVSAVAAMFARAAAVPPGTSGQEDVRAAVRAVVDITGTTTGRAAYLAVLAAAARDEQVRARVEAEVSAPMRALIAAGVARAAARGEVPADVDVDWLDDVLAGTVMHRLLIRHQEIDDAFIDELAKLTLHAAVSGPRRPAR